MGGEGGGQAVHVVNIDIQDNHEEATIGAFLFNELVSIDWREGVLTWIHILAEVDNFSN